MAKNLFENEQKSLKRAKEKIEKEFYWGGTYI